MGYLEDANISKYEDDFNSNVHCVEFIHCKWHIDNINSEKKKRREEWNKFFINFCEITDLTL